MLICRGSISHDGFSTRCGTAGYGSCRENVAMNMAKDVAGGCKQAMEQWRKSNGHYKNIMADDVTVLGASYAACNGKYYYTQLFGKNKGPLSAQRPTVPAPSSPKPAPLMSYAPEPQPKPEPKPAPAPAPPPPPPAAPSSGNADAGEKVMLDETNRMRARAGKKPLSFDSKGAAEAKQWSQQMCQRCAPLMSVLLVSCHFLPSRALPEWYIGWFDLSPWHAQYFKSN
jgi:uncharacterized protein YkwD